MCFREHAGIEGGARTGGAVGKRRTACGIMRPDTFLSHEHRPQIAARMVKAGEALRSGDWRERKRIKLRERIARTADWHPTEPAQVNADLPPGRPGIPETCERVFPLRPPFQPALSLRWIRHVRTSTSMLHDEERTGGSA